MSRPAFTPGEGGGKPAKPEPAPQFPWLVPQPRPQPEPEPEETSVTPVINIVSSNPPPLAQQTSAKPRPATTRPGPVLVPPKVLDINGDAPGSLDRHIAALNSGQSTLDFPPDIEWSPEDEPSGIIPFVQAAAAGTRDGSEDKATAVCEALYAANPEGVARGIKIMRGAELDEEEDSVQELTRIFQTIAPHGLFEDEPWYTTSLDHIAPNVSARTSDYSFDHLQSGKTASDEELGETTPTSEYDQISDEQQVPVEIPEVDSSRLNQRTREYLKEHFPDWDPDWTTKAQLRDFLVDRMRELYPSMNADLLQWDELSIQEVVHLYKIGLEEGSILAQHTMVGDLEGFARFVEERRRTIGLLEMVEETPVENLEVLLAAYSNEFESEAGAVEFFRSRIEVLYPKLGFALPADLSEINDAVHLANMYFVGLERFKAYEDGQDVYFDATVGDWQGFYGPPQGSLDHDFDVLAGTYQPPDLSMLVFVASIFIEPLDWALTTIEVVDAAARGDWGSALESALWGIVPFVPGSAKHIPRIVNQISNVTPNISRTAKGLSNASHVEEVSRVSRRITSVDEFPGPHQRPGSAYIPSVEPKAFSSKKASHALSQEVDQAAAVDPSFEKRAKAHSGQDMHHLVAVNDELAKGARGVLFNKGIPINSAYNGVALERIVHQYAANNREYVQTVNTAIMRLIGASPAQVDEFLRKLSDQFLLLNDFLKSDAIAGLSRKQQGAAIKNEASSLIIQWTREYPYP